MIGGLENVSALSLSRGLSSTALDQGPAAAGDAFATTGAGAASAAGGSFADALGRMASDAVGDLRGAEKMAIQGIKGEASTRQVVDAVMTAQQTLQTALAIRDKIVSAYLDISRMTI
jgi:flagellar hook-basal body complex protein FliE